MSPVTLGQNSAGEAGPVLSLGNFPFITEEQETGNEDEHGHDVTPARGVWTTGFLMRAGKSDNPVDTKPS